MRERWEMPDDVLKSLVDNNVYEAYKTRPPYQQNDYIGWINQAKRKETRQKRTNQMISELKAGNVYMKMDWNQ